MPLSAAAVVPILLVNASNVFMTTAWYGHLRFPQMAMWAAVLIGWGSPFSSTDSPCPPTGSGSRPMTWPSSRPSREVISLSVFVVFAVVVLGEKITLNHIAGFAFIGLGPFFIFKGPLPESIFTLGRG